MSSYLDFEGKYDPDKRFVVQNVFAEDFKSFWDGKPIFIKSGDMHECEHAIAYKLTKELVDREMFKLAEEAYIKAGDNKQFADKVRERGEMAVNNKDARKPFEDKILTELRAGEENPIMKRLRDEIRAEEQEKNRNATADAAAGVQADSATIKAPEGSLSNDKAVDNTPARKSKRKGEFEE